MYLRIEHAQNIRKDFREIWNGSYVIGVHLSTSYITVTPASLLLKS